MVDPRPVSDRSYQYRCVQTLVEFLSEHMYDQVIPQAQALLRRGPSKKDFENMILFLFKLIDPTFEFKGKFEEDVVQQLRDLRYPISISKTSLAAVGTPHTWPMLLMAMSWLIELLSYDEAIQQASENEQDGENDEENGDKPFFKYLDASYHVFLAGDDDKFEALENQEREKLIARNEVVKQETSELEQQREHLKKRIEKVKMDKKASAELSSKKSDCESDLLKFRKLVYDLERTKVKLKKKIESLHDVQQACDDELTSRQEEIKRLQTRISNQELSAHDIEQIGLSRARLYEQIHKTIAQQDEFQKRIKIDENRAARIRDDLDAHIHQYLNTCKQLKMIPVTAKNSLQFDFSLELDQNLDELDAVKKVTHDLKTRIRQGAHELKQNRLTRANTALDEALELDAKLQTLENQLNNELEKEKDSESKARSCAEQMQREREKQAVFFRRRKAASEEVEKKIKQITNGDNLAEEEVTSRQHLLDVRKASVDMTEGYKALIEMNQNALTHVLVACTNHKGMADKAISSLEAEVNKVEL